MNQAEKLWNQAKPPLQEEVNSAVYLAFIDSIEALDIEGDTLILEVQSTDQQSYLRNRYIDLIEGIVERAAGRRYEISFVLPGEFQAENDQSAQDNNMRPNFLNPRYTFDNFVIGQSNHFAHAAAHVVANNPGKNYNPLFIYGGVGLGKTHLMHAIGNQILSDNPNTRISYVTSETFTNEMIAAIRSDRNEEFRARYRHLDVLMIDDIQFISNKEGTQTEFFNTFNQLYEGQKQIVISSDKPPKEIPTLEDRLRSRFEWGLQVDVQPPDFETRVAILQKKAETDNLTIPSSVMNFIAESVKSNIRELEGSLTKVIFYASLKGEEVDLALAEEALKDILTTGKKQTITMDLIKDVVADYYKIRVSDLEGKKRNRPIAFPRQVAIYLCRELTDEPLARIGESFGDRHHSTIIHDCEVIVDKMKNDIKLQTTIDDIMQRLRE